MIKQIELFEKEINGENQSVVAECNGYVDGILKKQFSRSKFVFPATMTDQEIIESLWLNEYSIYA